MRELTCELNYLSKPDGSAILSTGNSVVLSAIYGPMDVKLQNLNIEKATVEVLFQSKSGQPAVGHRLRENLLKQVVQECLMLQLHPRTSISVAIQELEDHGGLLSCCFNATCLALINSGISMLCLFAAVNCAVFEDGDVVFDPSDKEQIGSLGTVTFVFENIDYRLLSCVGSAKLTKDLYMKALVKCREESKIVFDFYRTIVRKYAPTI